VGDEGLKFLKDLSALKSLRLRRTLVTDKGVPELTSLKNLEFVDLAETKVTREGAHSLQAALPNCKVEL
jgi:hypothetical protein